MSTVALKVPTPVIRFVVLARETNKVARKVEEEAAVREVVRAVNEFAYAQEVTS